MEIGVQSFRRALMFTSWFCALGLPLAAWSFSVQGPRWPNTESQPVPFTVSPAGSDDVSDGSDLAAVRSAFASWQDVECSFLSFEEQAWVEPGQVADDGVNRVYWEENEANWPGTADTLGLTFTFFLRSGEQPITDADMILNGIHWTWTTDANEVGQGPAPGNVDIETVVLHEAGHFFGLAHSQDPDSVMFATNNKPTQRSLDTDDVQGICALYSNGQPVPGGSGGAVGSPCTSGGDCTSQICVDDLNVGRAYCSQVCVAGQTDACPVGFSCEAGGDGNSYCLAPIPVDELCDQCTNGNQCSSGLCVTVANVNDLQPFCSQTCDPTEGAPNTCPNGYRCEVARLGATFLGACVPNTGLCEPSGKGGQDELCFANGRCKPGHRCIEYFAGSGIFFCHADCAITQIGLSCGFPRSRCDEVPRLMNTPACFTFANVGEPCIPEVCDPNRSFCAWDETVGIDSALCYQLCPNGASDCPANTQCQTFTGLPSLCVPNEGFKRDGDVCVSDAECESRTCRPFGTARLCTRACTAADAAACTPGLRCYTEPGDTSGFCGPQVLPNPTDPPRDVRDLGDETYCPCDRTNSCDDNCGCDPECGGSGCAHLKLDGRAPMPWASIAVVLAAALSLTVRSRTRRRARAKA